MNDEELPNALRHLYLHAQRAIPSPEDARGEGAVIAVGFGDLLLRRGEAEEGEFAKHCGAAVGEAVVVVAAVRVGGDEGLVGFEHVRPLAVGFL